MVVPAFIEVTRDTPRPEPWPASRFATQPFTHSPEVFALLSLVQELQTKVNELEGERRLLSDNFRRLDDQVRKPPAEVQRAMLPAPTTLAGLEIRTLYRPLETLGGDLYDFMPLDDDHFGICLADACGHGLPAAMMGAFLKHAFRGTAPGGPGSSWLPPATVLDNVNRDLLGCPLDDGQFVTGLDAVYCSADRTLTFARGGMPYPILLRPGQAPQQLRTAGPLMGALPTARFESMTLTLEPGDCVLFYTDGLEALVCRHGRRGAYATITETPWYAQLNARNGAEVLADVASRLDHAHAEDWPADDISIVALCAA